MVVSRLAGGAVRNVDPFHDATVSIALCHVKGTHCLIRRRTGRAVYAMVLAVAQALAGCAPDAITGEITEPTVPEGPPPSHAGVGAGRTLTADDLSGSSCASRSTPPGRSACGCCARSPHGAGAPAPCTTPRCRRWRRRGLAG